MSEIEPVDEACFLIESCAEGGRYTGMHRPNFVDQIQAQGFVRFSWGMGGQRAHITPAGKARLKKLVDQLTRSAPNV